MKEPLHLERIIYCGKNPEEDEKAIKMAIPSIIHAVQKVLKTNVLNQISRALDIFSTEFIKRFQKSLKLAGWDEIETKESAVYKMNSLGILPSVNKIGVLDWALFYSRLISDEELLPLRISVDRSDFRISDNHNFPNGQIDYDTLISTQPIQTDHSFAIIILSHTKRDKGFTVFNSTKHKSIPYLINKSIEFPPELYEAGRGILSYFGTYLNEKYTDQKASVKIEQDADGKTLRMTVESETGEKEVIEKALTEYQLIVTGKARAEDLTDNQSLILGLRDEARMLQFRMESQRDKMALLQGQVQDKDLRIDRLLNIVEKGFENKTPIQIVSSATSDSSSNATASATATAIAEAHQNLSLAIGGVNELKDLVPASSAEARELRQLEQGLQAIKKEQDPEVVSTSPAMVKFKRILEKIRSKEGKLAKAVEAAENGYEVFKDVAGTYNKIADWCGLPHVPGVLLNN